MVFIHSIPVSEPLPCPACGIGLGDISQTGRVGCPDCYRHFSERLTPYIRRVHGPAAHTGRIPKSAGEHLYQKRRLSELQSALRDAIERQEFERCAELRDEIKSCSIGSQVAERGNSLAPSDTGRERGMERDRGEPS